MADTVVQELVINTLTQAQFNAAKEAGTLSPYELYGTPDTSVRLPVLTPMWFDHVANDMSWLRADTFSWQSGDVYVVAYGHLADELKTDSLVYAWEEETSGDTEFTRSDTPSVGDLTINGTEITVVGSEFGDYISVGSSAKRYYRTPSLDRLVDSPSVDTIGDITITYYQAEDGHKICLPDQESNIVALYEKTGAADYYLLDTTNKQFKLPRKQKRTLIQAVKNTDGTWYNLYSDGWVEQGGQIIRGIITFAIPMADLNYTVSGAQIGPGSTNGTYYSAYKFVNMRETGIDLDNAQNEDPLIAWSVSGYAAESVYASSGMRLEYYYVGNFTQEAIEQTAGLNSELFNGKADVSRVEVLEGYDYVIESQLPTADNNYTWYRKYKSGWVEQGGRTDLTSGNNNITLPIPMLDVNYTALVTRNSGASATSQTDIWRKTANDTTTTFCVYAVNGTGAIWTVSGMSEQ